MSKDKSSEGWPNNESKKEKTRMVEYAEEYDKKVKEQMTKMFGFTDEEIESGEPNDNEYDEARHQVDKDGFELEQKREKIDQQIAKNEADIGVCYAEIQEIQERLDKLLELLEQIDDRKIDVTKLDKAIIAHVGQHLEDQLFSESKNVEEFNPLRDYMKNFFDITDDELDDEQRHERFALEVGRAALQIQVYFLENQIESLQRQALKLHKDTDDYILTRKFLAEHAPTRRRGRPRLSRATLGDGESHSEREPKKPILVQFDMIHELELKLRELLKEVFSEQQDWWNKFIPFEIREKCQYRNRKNPEYENLLNEQSSDLIDKLMFSEVQMTITGSGNSNFNDLFKDIFDGYHYANSRLIEANILRNKICHQETLNKKKQMQLEHIKSELIYDINEYLGDFEV